MKWAFGFLTLCIVLAIIRAVLIALAIATVLALVFCFATRPREMLLFLGVFIVTGLASARPTVFIVTLGVIGLVVFVAGIKRKRLNPLQLRRPGEHS